MDTTTTDYTCRICLEDNLHREDVIAPCACAGTSKWVHRECLDRWRSVREDKAFSKCTECLQYYELVCVTSGDDDKDEETVAHVCWRRTRFSLLVFRDFFLLLLATQLIVLTFTMLFYLFDHQSHHLAAIFGMDTTRKEKIFYYLAGLGLFFAILGMIGVSAQFSWCGSCDNCCNSNRLECTYCCNDCVFCPYYLNPIPIGEPAGVGAAGEGCCCRCCDGAACADCHGCCRTAASGAGGTASCECGECLSGLMGNEIGFFVIMLLFVIFVLLGLFFFCAYGLVLVQKIVSRHIHVLEKYNLTREYIVRDLASEPTDLGRNSGGSRGTGTISLSFCNPFRYYDCCRSFFSKPSSHNRGGNHTRNTLNDTSEMATRGNRETEMGLVSPIIGSSPNGGSRRRIASRETMMRGEYQGIRLDEEDLDLYIADREEADNNRHINDLEHTSFAEPSAPPIPLIETLSVHQRDALMRRGLL